MGGDPLRRPAFLAAIDEVETRIRQNRARLARQHRSAALAALPEDLDQLKELWDNIWDLDRKRALLDTLIEKVTVRPSTLGSKTGRKFDRSRPDRLASLVLSFTRSDLRKHLVLVRLRHRIIGILGKSY